MIFCNWSDLKTFVDQREILVQYISFPERYLVIGIDNGFAVCCDIYKKDPPSADQLDFETNYKPKGNKKLIRNSPFADKVLPNGKKLYNRSHGTSGQVQGSADIIDFTIPYPACKLSGIEIINGLIGDTCNLKILDTPQGTYSGEANKVLNQFGFDVNVAEKFYRRESDYDADLYQGMVIRIEYDSVASVTPATVYINFLLHEVKD